MKYFQLLFIAVVLLSFKSSAQQPDTTISFKVSGVCELCKARIEKSLKVKGISKAEWDVSTQLVSISYQPALISIGKIHDRIAAAGHDTESKKATDKAYAALP